MYISKDYDTPCSAPLLSNNVARVLNNARVNRVFPCEHVAWDTAAVFVSCLLNFTLDTTHSRKKIPANFLHGYFKYHKGKYRCFMLFFSMHHVHNECSMPLKIGSYLTLLYLPQIKTLTLQRVKSKDSGMTFLEYAGETMLW